MADGCGGSGCQCWTGPPAKKRRLDSRRRPGTVWQAEEGPPNGEPPFRGPASMPRQASGRALRMRCSSWLALAVRMVTGRCLAGTSANQAAFNPCCRFESEAMGLGALLRLHNVVQEPASECSGRAHEPAVLREPSRARGRHGGRSHQGHAQAAGQVRIRTAGYGHATGCDSGRPCSTARP